jgi:hypothetical protein
MSQWPWYDAGLILGRKTGKGSIEKSCMLK